MWNSFHIGDSTSPSPSQVTAAPAQKSLPPGHHHKSVPGMSYHIFYESIRKTTCPKCMAERSVQGGGNILQLAGGRATLSRVPLSQDAVSKEGWKMASRGCRLTSGTTISPSLTLSRISSPCKLAAAMPMLLDDPEEEEVIGSQRERTKKEEHDKAPGSKAQ